MLAGSAGFHVICPSFWLRHSEKWGFYKGFGLDNQSLVSSEKTGGLWKMRMQGKIYSTFPYARLVTEPNRDV